MSLRFNVAGPCLPALHYLVPAASRLPKAPELIDELGYFAVHAPRQSGKTTVLRELAGQLTAGGEYAALHFSCEVAQAAGDDHGAAQRALLGVINRRARQFLPPDLRPPEWPDAADGILLGEALTTWAQACPRPLALFFDEIDALTGRSLVSVLRQLREGFDTRPDAFPAAVALCGLRDVREYRADSDGSGGPSPFNVRLDALRLPDLTAADVASLYGQHTEATGQEFTPAAVERAFELTAGQAWLVNALARTAVEKTSATVTAEDVDEAAHWLVRARATPLNALTAKLAEARVSRIVEPMLAGTVLDADSDADPQDDDVPYLRDLGLLAQMPPVRLANPIYREVVVRVLTTRVEESIDLDPSDFICSDGHFDVDRLLAAFVEFWRGDGELLAFRERYQAAASQLLLLAFLHRAVDPDGRVAHEYGIGRGRIEVLVRWPYDGGDGTRAWQLVALELRVHRPGDVAPAGNGLAQFDEYLDRLGLETGVQIIFDGRPTRIPFPVAARPVPAKATTPTGRTVTVLRL
jgi:hypothetical protein